MRHNTFNCLAITFIKLHLAELIFYNNHGHDSIMLSLLLTVTASKFQ